MHPFRVAAFSTAFVLSHFAKAQAPRKIVPLPSPAAPAQYLDEKAPQAIPPAEHALEPVDLEAFFELSFIQGAS